MMLFMTYKYEISENVLYKKNGGMTKSFSMSRVRVWIVSISTSLAVEDKFNGAKSPLTLNSCKIATYLIT